MPLQDAIDLAIFLVDVTIRHSQFFPGAQVVGGPIEVAAISRHENFKWIQRKHYYRQELNLPPELFWPDDTEPAKKAAHPTSKAQKATKAHKATKAEKAK